ncbi:tRNA (adenosine(37)-N6)-dimethylallyltransferase MiaA [Bacillus sp. 1P06AnD]|uniref:tRNA (adenosine(37)-N6)-dimethylallyltransferase MiaA n=1 Tax=Bacillus sp. 1P06AnD TaxID=3132208 RepID=UPI0039A14D3D
MKRMRKQKLVCIMGPTAVGKTRLSVDVAKAFSGEIISGDSMQVYRGMDIGTAKITNEEMEGIPHHLIDIKNPDEPFNVAQFQELVTAAIEDISSRGHVPIIAGGTGLYIEAVLQNYSFSESVSDPAYRSELESIARKDGVKKVHQMLAEIDSESAHAIHPNNTRRVIRALEIYHCTGEKMSDQQQKENKEYVYDAALIGLNIDRETLYERIDKRVDLMLEAGLLNEVKGLYERGFRDCQSIQAIGYKELYAYFDGLVSYEDAVQQLKQNSRRYAKRQLTWFRNKMDLEWFKMDDEPYPKKVHEILAYVEGKLSIEANYKQ